MKQSLEHYLNLNLHCLWNNWNFRTENRILFWGSVIAFWIFEILDFPISTIEDIFTWDFLCFITALYLVTYKWWCVQPMLHTFLHFRFAIGLLNFKICIFCDILIWKIFSRRKEIEEFVHMYFIQYDKKTNFLPFKKTYVSSLIARGDYLRFTSTNSLFAVHSSKSSQIMCLSNFDDLHMLPNFWS